MTLLWIEPTRCRWCGEWTFCDAFCTMLCEESHDQRQWVEHPNLSQARKENRG